MVKFLKLSDGKFIFGQIRNQALISTVRDFETGDTESHIVERMIKIQITEIYVWWQEYVFLLVLLDLFRLASCQYTSDVSIEFFIWQINGR